MTGYVRYLHKSNAQRKDRVKQKEAFSLKIKICVICLK